MRSTVEAANQALRHALAQGSGSAAGALYADDAVLVTPSAELLEGRDAIERFWQAGIEVGIGSIELRPILARGRDPVAYGFGSYRWRVGSSTSETATDDGTYLAIVEREAGRRWKRTLDFFNSAQTSARAEQAIRTPRDPRRHLTTDGKGC